MANMTTAASARPTAPTMATITIVRLLMFAVSLEEAARLAQGVLQSFQGADVAIAGGRLLQPEHLGRFVVGQLLEVPQRQDFAIERVHGVEHFLKANPQLRPLCRLR